MNLHSKSFIAAVALFVAFTFLSLSPDCSAASAQKVPGKQAETKALDQAVANPDTVLVTFVEIGSVKCIPCKAMQPIMKAVEEEYRGQVKIVFHDIWTPQGKTDGMKYNIRIIPRRSFWIKTARNISAMKVTFRRMILSK